MTVGDAIAQTLARAAGEASETSQHTYKWHGKNAAKYWGEGRELSTITRLDVQAWVNTRRPQVAAATLHAELWFFKRLYQEAFITGEDLYPPTRRLILPPVDNVRDRTLTVGEVEELRKRLNDPWHFSKVLFLLHTSMRRIEAFRIRSSEVRLWVAGENEQPGPNGSVVKVPVWLGEVRLKKTKTKTQRTQVLNPVAASIAQVWLSRKQEFLFSPDNGNRLQAAQSWADEVLVPVLRDMGIESGNACHMLRRTSATWAQSAGCRTDQIGKFLGHECLATTEGYMHANTHQAWPVAMALAKRVGFVGDLDMDTMQIKRAS